MSDLTLTAPLFAILTGFIEERVGMSYSASELELFATKVGARALDAGFSSLLDYYYFLRYDDADQREFRALVETLPCGVTRCRGRKGAHLVRCLCDRRGAVDARDAARRAGPPRQGGDRRERSQ
jgi:hypothetical protein